MYIATVPNRNSPPAFLLRESFRQNGLVKSRTLANLTSWPPARREALRQLLRGAFDQATFSEPTLGPISGLLFALKQIAEALGISGALGHTPIAKLGLFLILARVAHQAIDDDPPARFGLTLHAVEQYGLADAAEPGDQDVAWMPWVLQKAAHRLDLLLTVAQVRGIDAVSRPVRSGRPCGSHLISNDKTADLSIAMRLRSAPVRTFARYGAGGGRTWAQPGRPDDPCHRPQLRLCLDRAAARYKAQGHAAGDRSLRHRRRHDRLLIPGGPRPWYQDRDAGLRGQEDRSTNHRQGAQPSAISGRLRHPDRDPAAPQSRRVTDVHR